MFEHGSFAFSKAAALETWLKDQAGVTWLLFLVTGSSFITGISCSVFCKKRKTCTVVMRGPFCPRSSIPVEETSLLWIISKLQELDLLPQALTFIQAEVVKWKPGQLEDWDTGEVWSPKPSSHNSRRTVIVCQVGRSLQCRAGMQPGIKGPLIFTWCPWSTLVSLPKEDFKLRVKKLEIPIRNGQKSSSSLLATNIDKMPWPLGHEISRRYKLWKWKQTPFLKIWDCRHLLSLISPCFHPAPHLGKLLSLGVPSIKASGDSNHTSPTPCVGILTPPATPNCKHLKPVKEYKAN